MSEISATPRLRRSAWWADGTTAADAGAPGSPEWARFIDAVSAHPAYDVPLDDGDPCAPFGRALAPYAGAAVERVRAEVGELPGVDLPAVLAQTAADLAARLGALAARTFVYELHTARPTLAGATGAERFADFLRRVDVRGLLADYPVLARIVGQTCLRTAEATAELLGRLAADHAAVAGLLGRDPGRLVSVRAGAGDRHDGGRAVALLRFADGGGLAYQPRPLELHARFGDLVTWLDGRIGFGLRPAACVVRTGYGWVELIEHRPCADSGEVELFYRRQGALLALLYAVDGTDVHYENLIAAGPMPVLVDVETLFHPSFPEESAAGPDPAGAALAASVARTALLPVMAMGDGGALDVSGLGAAEGWFPVTAPRWVDAGTDAMRLRPCRVAFAGADNRPVLDGRPAEPAEHVDALLAGFRAGYEAITARAAEFAGLLARCADAETRVVLRHTQRYSDVLAASTHPDLLRRAADRDRLLALLRADPPAVDGVVDSEIAALWAGDVPTFRTRPASRHIWTADGACLPHRLRRTGLRAATAKLARMGPVDQRAQEWIVTAAFAARNAPVRHRFTPDALTPDAPGLPEALSAAQATATAVAVVEDIGRRALHGASRMNWLGLEAVDDRFWSLLPMGAGLLGGYSGVALCAAQVGVLADRPDLRALAARAIAPLTALVERFAADPGLARMAGGGMAGVAGLGYAMARVGGLLGDRDLLAGAEALLPAFTATSDAATVHDGAAGAVLAALAVHAATGSAAAADTAAESADRLLDPGALPPGFLRGLAGTGHAALAYAEAAGSERHRAAGRQALDAAASAIPDDAGWCAGWAGIALACAAAGRPVPPPPPDAARPGADASLCHGEIGVLTALAAHAGSGALARRGARLLDVRTPPGPRGGAPSGVATPGLLTGSAGIAYGLAHLAHPQRVPSVLIFAPDQQVA